MAIQLPLLETDLTGLNINNKIINEQHSLSGLQIRSIAPKKGPFFGESLVVRDGVTTLTRGQDYQLVELHQELTLLAGKEVNGVILIINSNVGSTIHIDYQAVGGHYAGNNPAIANLYQSLYLDDRPVDFSDILNLPSEFNPTIHRHLLDDIYGFEPIVDYLERIKRAITLGQTTVLLEVLGKILGNLTSKFECNEVNRVLPYSKLMSYDIFMHTLTRRKLINDVNVYLDHCTWLRGTNNSIKMDTSSVGYGETYYWEIFSMDPDQVVDLTTFNKINGTFNANGGEVDIRVYLEPTADVPATPYYVGIKKNSYDPEYLAISYVLNVGEVANPIESPDTAPPAPTISQAYAYMVNRQPTASAMETQAIRHAYEEDLRLWYLTSTGTFLMKH